MLLSNFVHSLRQKLQLEQRTGTSRAYESTLRSVISFFGKEATPADVFTRENLIAYQTHLRSHNCSWNTVSFYMRTLKRLYNLAFEAGHIPAVPKLFADVFTSNDPTAKRALSMESIVMLEDADLSENPRQEFSRDMFLLSYYLHGISFIDMAYLRKTDLKKETLTYHRRKTGSSINTPVDENAMRIIQKYLYLTTGSPYLLPIIREAGKNEYQQYQTALRNYNRRLKAIATRLGIKETLTSYVSRHS